MLPELVRALTAAHHPRESRSIDTLSCAEHNVTNGPRTWRDDPDYDACPHCVVTPITVCSSWGCETYPCATIRLLADTLGVTLATGVDA